MLPRSITKTLMQSRFPDIDGADEGPDSSLPGNYFSTYKWCIPPRLNQAGSPHPFFTLSASVSFIMSSALTPAQTAHALVELGIAKHNTRYEIVFLKAVCCQNSLSAKLLITANRSLPESCFLLEDC